MCGRVILAILCLVGQRFIRLGDTGLTLSQNKLLHRVVRYFRQVHGAGEGARPRADGA